MFEVGVDHAVGEALAADTDALEYAVTGQLMHYQVRVDDACTESQDTGQRSDNTTSARVSARITQLRHRSALRQPNIGTGQRSDNATSARVSAQTTQLRHGSAPNGQET